MTFEEFLNNYCNGDITVCYYRLSQVKEPFEKSLDQIRSEYDPNKHKVFDQTYRKKKKTRVQDGYDEHGEPKYKNKYAEVCRVAIPVQRVLVERSVGFLFSIPVDYSYKDDVSDAAQELHNTVLKCFEENKIDYFDKKLAREVAICREAAELWYHLPDEDGKPSGDIRVMMLSPLKGDELLPMFDAYGRMIAFMRVYYTKDYIHPVRMRHIDVYTSKMLYSFVADDNNQIGETSVVPHGFDRIPLVYYRQDETEWDCVQPAIQRMEDLVSNWGDTDDYFGSPSYFVKGSLLGYAEKGEQGKIYQADGDSDMRVLSWDNSPESMRNELATLTNIVFSYTQTPDVSFENMKTLCNNTSGVALKLMFTDPHMKAQVKTEMYGEMFTRRYNIVKAVLAALNGTSQRVADELYVRPLFTPYVPQNDLEALQMLTQCTTQPILSQETAVAKNPLVDNPQDEITRLQTETAAQTERNLFEATE